VTVQTDFRPPHGSSDLNVGELGSADLLSCLDKKKTAGSRRSSGLHAALTRTKREIRRTSRPVVVEFVSVAGFSFLARGRNSGGSRNLSLGIPN
jgi:hypothetical protein